MYKLGRWIVTIGILLASAVAFGQNGILNVRATVVGSTHLEVQAAGQTASGPGTASFTATLGSLSGMQAAPSGFMLTRDNKHATLSSVVETRALKANLPNAGYSLTVRLLGPLPYGVTWSLNGVALSADKAATVAWGTFGTGYSLNLQIDIKDPASTALLDNSVVFSIVPN